MVKPFRHGADGGPSASAQRSFRQSQRELAVVGDRRYDLVAAGFDKGAERREAQRILFERGIHALHLALDTGGVDPVVVTLLQTDTDRAHQEIGGRSVGRSLGRDFVDFVAADFFAAPDFFAAADLCAAGWGRGVTPGRWA